MGYNFASYGPVQLRIDRDKEYPLYPDGDTAWTQSLRTDQEIVDAFATSSRMVVQGRSSAGIDVIDTYGLSGFSEALDMIDRACSV